MTFLSQKPQVANVHALATSWDHQLKVAATIESAKYGKVFNSANYWYAPDVKQIIKSDWKRKIIKLKLFEIGEGPPAKNTDSKQNCKN